MKIAAKPKAKPAAVANALKVADKPLNENANPYAPGSLAYQLFETS